VSFRDIVGHDKAISFLRAAIASGRAGASLIFHGPAGVGRKTTALALAQAFNCTEEPGEGCGQCSICNRITHLEESTVPHGDHKGDACVYTRHADVKIIVPGKEEIRISEVRAVRQQAQRRPFEGERSMFIFDPAERMTVEAANALLKTLEEPPPTSCIVLIASDPAALLPTIRSRCRLVPFHPLAIADVADYLVREREVKKAEALMIARLSGGRLGTALSFELDEFQEQRQVILEMLRRLCKPGTRAHVLKDAEKLGSRGERSDVSQSLNILESVLRDSMILVSGGDKGHLIHADLAPELADLGRLMGDRAEAGISRIAQARSDLVRNVNRQLLLEVMLLDMASGQAAGTP
jgi:DNA polymerase-3 subunit delta'